MTQEQGDDNKEKDACNDTLQALWSEGGREGGRESGREMGEGAQVMGEVYVNNNKINRQPQQQQTDYNDKNNKQLTNKKQQQTDHKQQQQQTDHKQQQTKTSIAAVCSPVWSRCGSGL